MSGPDLSRPLARIELVAGGRVLGRNALHERLAARLRTMIIELELAPGSKISEAGLCATLGASRTPIREALKLLGAEGLVDLRPNRSPMIAPMPAGAVADLFEVMADIERLGASLAAERIAAGELRRLTVLQQRMERLHEQGRRDEYFALNQTIHRTIIAAAGNAVLEETHQWLLGRASRARYFALKKQQRWDDSIQEHRAILAALQDADAALAGRLLGEHVRRTGEVVVAALGGDRSAHVASPTPLQTGDNEP